MHRPDFNVAKIFDILKYDFLDDLCAPILSSVQDSEMKADF